MEVLSPMHSNVQLLYLLLLSAVVVGVAVIIAYKKSLIVTLVTHGVTVSQKRDW